MKIVKKILKNLLFRKAVVFAILFSIAFFWIRTRNLMPLTDLSKNLSSMVSLYSVIGIIYSIISGFIIQNQWNIWDKLIAACNAEINALRQLLLLVHHFPQPYPKNIKIKIKSYLTLLVNEFWKDKDLGVRTGEINKSLSEIEDTLYYASEEVPKLNIVTLNLLNEIVRNRELRLHYSSRHLPVLIKLFVVYMTFTMITLSLFIPMNNVYIDYVFTFSVALHCFTLYLIIDDLEHPYRPGTWHVSMKEYARLLAEM